MIQLLSALLVTVLTVFLGPVLRGEVNGRLVRRARAVAELREKVQPGSDAERHLNAFLDSHAAIIRAQGRARLHRKVNGGNVATLIFVAVVGGGIVYVLLSVAVLVQSAPFFFWLLLVAALFVAGMTFGLAAVGLRSIFDPKKPSQKNQASSNADADLPSGAA